MNKPALLFIFSLFTSTVLYCQEGQLIYRKYCAGCHGGKLEGNSASTLIKKDWRYGKGAAAVHQAVKAGVPNTEMIAWAPVLNEKEITAVVNFIMAAQKEEPAIKGPIPGMIRTKDYTLTVEKLVTKDIQHPWAIEFVDATRALLTEKSGKLRWMVNGKLDPQDISGLPATHTASGTGGYMDIALDPDYSTNGWIYLAYSHTHGDISDKAAPAMTRIVRGRVRDHQWIDQQTLFQVPDSLMVVGGDRWGCRFLFDKEGLLYFTIGDMGKAEASQDLSRATGKVFRIHPDGAIPGDNPFIKVPHALPAIFSYGNRNVQGIAEDPVTGKIWVTEHGPRGGDELNILKKGANYGWPVITYGIDYSGKVISDKVAQEGMEQPVTQWTPSIAVCPATFCTGTMFSRWQNNLLVGALAYEELHRLVIENDKVVSRELLFKGYGRVRDVKMAPDGAMYVVLNKPDMIVRVTLKK